MVLLKKKKKKKRREKVVARCLARIGNQERFWSDRDGKVSVGDVRYISREMDFAVWRCSTK